MGRDIRLALFSCIWGNNTANVVCGSFLQETRKLTKWNISENTFFRNSCVLTVSSWSWQLSDSLVKVILSKCGYPVVSGNPRNQICLCVCFFICYDEEIAAFWLSLTFPVSDHFSLSSETQARHDGVLQALWSRCPWHAIICNHGLIYPESMSTYIYIYLQFLSFRNIEMGKVALQYIKNGPQGCRLTQIFGPFCSEVCPGKMTEDPLTDEPDCIANNVSATWKWGTFYLHELSLIPACISNHTLRKVWVK